MKSRILEILTQSNPKISMIKEENLLEKGLINSFEITHIIMELENTFNIEIEPDQIIADNFQTIDSIVNLVQNALQRKDGDL